MRSERLTDSAIGVNTLPCTGSIRNVSFACHRQTYNDDPFGGNGAPLDWRQILETVG